MKKFKDLCKWSPTFVLATMFLAACSQSELVEDIAKGQNDNAPQAVEFGTFVGKNTRTTTGATGGITTAQVLANKSGFGVFAYYTNAATYGNTATTGSQAPNFMYNQQVTGTNVAVPVWSYTPLKYWPNDTSDGVVDGASATGSTAGGGKVSFFAYAPYVETATGDDGIIGMPFLDLINRLMRLNNQIIHQRQQITVTSIRVKIPGHRPVFCSTYQ